MASEGFFVNVFLKAAISVSLKCFLVGVVRARLPNGLLCLQRLLIYGMFDR